MRVLRVTVFLFGILLLGGCFEQDRVEWRLQSQAVESSIDFQELKLFAESIRQMSGGRFTISIHPGGEIAGGPAIFNAVSEGTVEMGNGWPNWWSGQHPAWAVMNAGPFDFMNLDASMMFFLADEGTALANQLANPRGVLWRPAWWPGMEFGLLSREPLTGLDDLKGKKVRIGPGLPSEVLSEASGALTIPLVPAEIEPALRAGELDAVEWTTANGAWDLGLQELSPHAIVPAIWQPSVLSDFLINQQAYDALTPDLQAILESAMKSFALTTTMKAKKADFAAMRKFLDSDITINRWSAADIERWRVANDRILSDYMTRDDFLRNLIEAKRRLKKSHDDYYQWFGPYE
jgi:TRAP-type mannitol/chloroaromatic compound transport system substrate-binding protein